jgi:hypothetical protein
LKERLKEREDIDSKLTETIGNVEKRNRELVADLQERRRNSIVVFLHHAGEQKEFSMLLELERVGKKLQETEDALHSVRLQKGTTLQVLI